MDALTGEELMKWVEHTTDSWQALLNEQPQILAFPCDIRETTNVGQLLQHIVAVELRFAERLLDQPQTGYDAIPYDSAEALLATHTRAMDLYRPLLAQSAEWWNTVIDVVTRSAGTFRVSRRTVLVHALMHSIRHYAQLATLVRTHGVQHNWTTDYLYMGLVDMGLVG
jgi:uncharacterized damage-inducible protein DinB